MEKPAAEEIEIGAGSALYISGWCFHSLSLIRRMRIGTGPAWHDVMNFNLFRPDVFQHFREKGQIYNHSVCSGFWCLVPLKYQGDGLLSLKIEVTLKNGRTIMRDLGQVRIVEKSTRSRELESIRTEIGRRVETCRSASSDPVVVICCATYNPDDTMFRRQIQSIKDQSFKNWLCIINDDCSHGEKYRYIQKTTGDDPRFLVFRNEKNGGFYHNFESLLRMVPENADFVALSDQDDCWFPEKLERCISAFDPDTTLVYSDMRIVDGSGRVISDTFWTSRRNQYTSLTFLILANTITGAASVFRTGIVPDLLPFPEEIADAFHDNWIGCVAFRRGKIRYLDMPLYDYYQHTGNVIGHKEEREERVSVVQAAGNLMNPACREQVMKADLQFYNTYGARRQAVAISLALRCDTRSGTAGRPAEPFYHLGRSSLGLLSLVLKARTGNYSTLGFEQRLFLGYLTARLLRTGLPEKRLLALMNQDQQTAAPAGGPYMYNFLLSHKLKPLSLHVSGTEIRRVNFVMEIFDFKYFFGGFFANFNLMKLMYQSGFPVRLILTDQASLDIDECRREIRKYEGLEDFFDHVTVEFAMDRTKPVTASPQDVFIAASCWTAYLCHEAAKEVSGDANRKFIFLVQEYEPFFYPHGSLYAIMDDAYNLPHYAIYSTSFLEEFFRTGRIGSVFSNGAAETGGNISTFYEHPVLMDKKEIPFKKMGKVKKFVFYTRPEEHAKRNMFDLGMLAVIRALEQKILDPNEWEFYGIGTISKDEFFPLIPGVDMKILPKVSLNDYYAMLCDFDLGLALMYTPHPSIPPLDMAAAGNIVVTTACFGKTPASLARISENLIAVEPRVDAIVEGISRGALLAGDYDRRRQNAKLNWPRSWDEAYTEEVRAKIIGFVQKAQEPY